MPSRQNFLVLHPKIITLTLIKSISGIRGTIGGKINEGLTPIDIVKYTSAFGQWILNQEGITKIVVGRDARISGEMVRNLVIGTLQGLGFDIIDLGLSTTPTVEIAVVLENAAGGIIITASHNPKQWNALKLLNNKGEFISEKDGAEVLEIAETGNFIFAEIGQIGKLIYNNTYINKHIELILNLPLVNIEAIKSQGYKVVIDCVNSTGGIALPPLLKALGVAEVIELYTIPDGNFPHNPEPLPEHLSALSAEVIARKANLGIAVDPDVDRLVFVSEDGNSFGEEYTLVAVADYILKHTPGNTVSNLSSTRALQDVTELAKQKYHASAVGEVHVVNLMKQTNAVIGGEGNGGIIYPELHFGRDALVGIALFLSHLAETGKTASSLKSMYPRYHISKNKITLTDDMDIDSLLGAIVNKYKKQPVNLIDGVRINFDKEWVHLRKSNTEPIIRIYAESHSETTADGLAMKIISDFKELIQKK